MSSCRLDRSFNLPPRTWFNKQRHASTAACSANFSGQSSGIARAANNAIYRRRGYRRQVSSPEGPLLAHQAAGFLPIAALQRLAHGSRDGSDDFKIPVDLFFAVDMRFEDFPVVDSGLPRLACVANHQPAFQFSEIHAQRLALFSSRLEKYRACSAKGWRIVILRSGWHADHNRFDIPADVNPVRSAQFRASEPVECGANRHRHRARAANP